MDGDTVHVAVVDEPDDLVREQLPVVLARQVGFRGLGAVSQPAKRANKIARTMKPSRGWDKQQTSRQNGDHMLSAKSISHHRRVQEKYTYREYIQRPPTNPFPTPRQRGGNTETQNIFILVLLIKK